MEKIREHWLGSREWRFRPLRIWSPLFVYRYFADLSTECADVVLEGDVFEEGVLQHGLQLLVDLETELQGHPRVGHLAVVQTRHDALTRPDFCLDKQELETFRGACYALVEDIYNGQQLKIFTVVI